MTYLGTRYRRLLVLFLALAFVRGMMYAALIPPWQAPDEIRHLEYVKLLSQQRRLLSAQDESLPIQREIIGSMIKHDYWRFGRATFAYDPANPPQSFKQIIWPVDPYWSFQPPLYYALGAVLTAGLAPRDVDLQLYIVRLLSVLLGVGVVLVAFVTVVELFPDEPSLVVGIPAFIAFLPAHTFITSAANNDNLAELLVSVVILLLVKVYKDGISTGRVVTMGVCVLLGLVAKRTSILTLPLLVMAVPIYLWTGGRTGPSLSRKAAVLTVASFSALAFAAVMLRDAGAALWKNVYPVLRPYFMLLPQADFSALFGPDGLRLLFDYGATLFETFWARFGWMNVRLDIFWYELLALVSAAAMTGLLVFVAQFASGRDGLAMWQKKCLLVFALAAGLAVIIAMLYGVRLWAHFQTFEPAMRPAPQGRYLFVAIIPIASLFVLGLRELVPARLRRFWLVALLGGLVALDALSIVRYIIPFYYG